MNCSDIRLAKILMDRNVEEARRLARSHHLVHPIEKAHPGWYRLLGQLGAWLVALGERLVQYAPVQPAL
jgi:hypothetical protein